MFFFFRFDLIYRSLHLVDEDAATEFGASTKSSGVYDPAYKSVQYMALIASATLRHRRPGSRLVIDEMMAPFAVSLIVQQSFSGVKCGVPFSTGQIYFGGQHAKQTYRHRPEIHRLS